MGIAKLGGTLFYNYSYDQLNRLTSMNAYRVIQQSNGMIDSLRPMQQYAERVSYDGNGNIERYLRNGSTADSLLMDSLSYHYSRDGAGRLVSNKLQWISDKSNGSTAHSSNYSTDLEDQQAGNYNYDGIGNLVKDKQEGVDSILWNVYGKIVEVRKDTAAVAAGAVSNIRYGYDAAGMRVSKRVERVGSDSVEYTWYVRDAQGSVMAVYNSRGSKTSDAGSFDLSLREQHLYGSSRLGMMRRNVDMKAAVANDSIYRWVRGNKLFELSNHLGNVLAVITDSKRGVTASSGDTLVSYYQPQLASAQDYYPFGMAMPGRGGYASGVVSRAGDETGSIPEEDMVRSGRTGNTPGEYRASRSITFVPNFESGTGDSFETVLSSSGAGSGSVGSWVDAGSGDGSTGYRYGFNGKENDAETSTQDYGMRIYDPRVGRFLSIDPISRSYPELTPYQFASNTPISAIDLDGLEAKVNTENNTYFVTLQNIHFSFVQRQSNQYFTQAAKDFPRHDFSINTQMFDYKSYWDYATARTPQTASDYTPQGYNIARGNITSGRSADKTFYLAHTKDDVWLTGYGDVPQDAKFGIGGGTPIVINGLKFGEENMFTDDAPERVKKIGAKGWVDPSDWKYLKQKSNGVYAGQNDRTVGKTILGFNSKADTWIIVSQQNGTKGFTLDEIRDRLLNQGYTNILAFDGSTSSTLVENGKVLVSPDQRKNSTIPSGVNLSVPDK